MEPLRIATMSGEHSVPYGYEYGNSFWHEINPRTDAHIRTYGKKLYTHSELTDKELQLSYPWLRVVDEALIGSHLDTANSSDNYDTARKKLNKLICWSTAEAQYFDTKLLEQALAALQHFNITREDKVDSKLTGDAIKALTDRLK